VPSISSGPDGARTAFRIRARPDWSKDPPEATSGAAQRVTHDLLRLGGRSYPASSAPDAHATSRASDAALASPDRQRQR
jgi:hypothetical protein